MVPINNIQSYTNNQKKKKRERNKLHHKHTQRSNREASLNYNHIESCSINSITQNFAKNPKKTNGLFGSLEREESKGEVEGNGYPLPCLDVFKISKGEGSS